MKRKYLLILLVLLLLLSTLLSAFCFRSAGRKLTLTEEAETTPPSEALATQTENSGSYWHINYKGKEYTYNSRIVTVMYAGVDSDEELITYNRYSIAPRADTIELVIFDDYNKKISILALSRDTITSVARYTMNGHYRDHYDTHLGYAYTYGDGGKASCENLTEAVSTLVNGVPIHEYVITNNSSVGELNDMVGGVTVTVPNDDLIKMYPEFKTGATVTLNAETADTFARWRDTSILYTNNGRMERQREFSTEFFKKFIELTLQSPEDTWRTIDAISDIYQTSIARNQYMDLADRFKTETFSENQYYIPKGENVHDDEHNLDRFYVDEEDLTEIIVKIFYLEDQG